VLRVLLSMHALRGALGVAASAAGSRRTTGRGSAEADAQGADAEAGPWAKVTRIAEGQLLRGGGVGAAGFSMSTSLTNIPPQSGGDLFHDEVCAAVRSLAGERGKLLLHVNNLENLRDGGTSRAAQLFRNLRGNLLIPGAHWLFVGPPSTAADVFQVHDETDGVMSEPVLLEPFGPEEVSALLERRYRELRRGVRFTAPVEPAAAARLYRRYRGDLRNFLRLLSVACERALHPDGSRALTEAEILAAVGPRYRARLVRELGADDFEALRRTCLAFLRVETGTDTAGQKGGRRTRPRPAPRGEGRRGRQGVSPELTGQAARREPSTARGLSG
jgi:hypothetical protein